MSTLLVLEGDAVALRPLQRADIGRLAEIGAHPDVSRWWPGLTVEHLLQKDEGRDDGAVAFAVEHEGIVIGLAQFFEHDDPEYRHASIDIFIAADHHGQGLGSDAVRTLARHLFRDRGHHRLTIDPAAANERAVRCYERVGFKRVGVLRRYWRDADGTWQDGLLLDLLADEL